MYGTHRLKHATVILIALIIAVVYALAMVACIMLLKSDNGVLTGSNDSSSDLGFSSEETTSNSDVSSVIIDTSKPDISGTESGSSGVSSSDIPTSDTSDTSSETTSSTDSSFENTSSGSSSSGNTSSGTTSSGNVSSDGNVTTPKSSFTSAIWYAYYELDFRTDTESTFKQKINKMFDNAVELGCDAVICQVRPFADAYYYSEYFPMSVYLSGTQGKDPGYDPLKYMVKAAHDRNLQIHAWLNPYRISNTTTNVNDLAENHPARVWLNDEVASNDRYVLTYKNGLYFNPSIPEVQKLIINGVREIVKNYDVDGIHFDDYFYPFVGTVDADFDRTEYEKSGTKISLSDWRRANVNALISGVYGAVKSLDSSVRFGISPSYHISKDGTDDNYNVKFADIAKWMNTSGYIDYIAPQLYFGYEYPIERIKYNNLLNLWMSIKRRSDVKVYIGIAAYKIGTVDAGSTEWQNKADILARQTKDAKNKGCSGVFIFSYSTIIAEDPLTTTQYNNLKDVLAQLKQE